MEHRRLEVPLWRNRGEKGTLIDDGIELVLIGELPI